MHDRKGRGELVRKLAKITVRMCVTKEMKVPALDEREGQMKHVGRVNVCDKGRKAMQTELDR